METRNCQNCKKDFRIEADDFSFYEKIKVPPPTFCSDCRKQRRLAFRNTHSLYKRKDSFSGKDIISIYSPDKDLCVIDQRVWWGDSWDPFDYGREYDFSRPFFEQWKEFRDKFPLQSMSNSKAVNSDYCNVAEESKDSYLCSASWKIERTMYSDAIKMVKDCVDVHVLFDSEFCYDDVVCTDSYELFYSQDCASCVDSYFLYDCRGCTNCFMSSNLRNKSYVMFNKQLTKEEYFRHIQGFNLGQYSVIQKYKKDFEQMKLNSIHRFAHITNSQNSTGNNIEKSKNCINCFDLAEDAEDCKDTFWALQCKNVHTAGPGLGLTESVYESFDAGAGGSGMLFSSVVYYSSSIEYSFNCYNCNNLFGCIGLRSKNYCIFNKQYEREDYLKMIDKIKSHMMEMPYKDKAGRIYQYGEFFPVELSPFSYNETVAQDYFPLNKNETEEMRFSWKEKGKRDYHPTIFSKDLPDHIKDVEDSIVEEIIECEHKGECVDRCTTAFKILPNELTFYRRFNIPLPRLCYGCRHYERLKKRNPMKLWKRKCMCEKKHLHHSEKCDIEFETSYAPERPEVVYCEKCYQAEVY